MVDAFGSGSRGIKQREPRRTTCSGAPQLRDTAASAADLDDTHDSGSDRAAHVTTIALQEVEDPRGPAGCGWMGEALRARWIAAVTAGRGEVPGGQGCRVGERH